jgi:transposase
MKYTFREFQKQYGTDDACLDSILARRYRRVDHCPKCGVEGKLTRIAGRRAYACKEGCHTYPCAGTVFEHSSTPLTLWFHAMYLMTATRNGVSGKELQRQLGVTYKCAYRIGMQIRKLMAARDASQNPGPLFGHVEVDETYVGGKQKRKKHKKSNKTIVMGMVQRGGPLMAMVVPSTENESLLPQIEKHIRSGTMINTDNWKGYKNLPKLGYRHVSVNHTIDQWAIGIHHTNRIEGFWSHLKRGLLSTHISVSRKHLQTYVGEFAYRYNARKDPANMFARMLSQISNPTSSEE